MARAARSGSRADTALVATCALLALLATVLPLPIRDAIASSLRRTLVAPLLALQERAERARTAFAERDAVAARLDSLVLRNAELGKMAQENVQLRGLLSLARQLQWGFVPAEALHGQGLGDEHVLLLTKGENAGVRMRSGVVAPDGLVGQVTTVDPRSSLAILWTHPDFRASAMSADGSAFGIVRPHLGDESGRSLLELRGVAFRDALEPGTLITTSGLGGVYPRGIPIGVVLRDIKTNEVWSRAYLLRPAVYPPDVSNVMILSPQRVAEGAMDSVWIDVSRAEGAARRLAASGDSLARLQAAASALRQRQMDSLKAVLGIPTVGDSAATDSLALRPDTLPARGDSARPPGRPAVGGAGTAAGRVPRRDSTPRRR